MVKFAGEVIANNCSSMLISGKKDEKLLQETLNELFRINDALRLRLCYEDGSVSQYLTEYEFQKFEVLYFQNEEELTEYADEYSKKELQSTEALCDFKIVVLPESYGILVKLHHIISDAWTFGLLYTQFNELLNGNFVSASSYIDYLEKEKKYVSSKRFSRDREFFMNQVNKVKDVTLLNEKEAIKLDTRRSVFVLEKDKTEKIKEFSEKYECSVFSFFSLVLAIYISRVKNGAERFFVGTTILNRHNERELSTAGVFVNSVPLLFEINSNEQFSSCLDKAEDNLMSVFRHQKYNYSDLLAEIKEKNVDFVRLYDVMINYMNATIDFNDESIRSQWYHNGQ